MRTRIFILFTISLLLSIGCTKEEGTDNKRATALESIRLSLEEVSGNADGIDPDNPTAAGAAARAQAGHIMTVCIGEGKGEYELNETRWVPTGKALEFIGYGYSTVKIELGKEGNIVQDGTKEQLLNADKLAYVNTETPPTRELKNIGMSHTNSLLEVSFSENISADDLSKVKFSEDIIPYNLPSSNKFQGIITPGGSSCAISFVYEGEEFDYLISESDLPEGKFEPDKKYRLTFIFDGVSLILKTIHVQQWSDAGTGAAKAAREVTFIFPGCDEALAFDVNFMYGQTSRASGPNGKGEYTVAGTAGDVVKSIVFTDDTRKTEYLIGRETGQAVTLAINKSGADYTLSHREKDGRVVVNSIAELRLLEANAANRAKSYIQECDLDFMDIMWRSLCGDIDNNIVFTGTYDGAGFSIHNLNWVGGFGGLFGVNVGTISNLTIASGYIDGIGQSSESQGINGAVCAYNFGTIEKCVNYADVSGSHQLGGICGSAAMGRIADCENHGNIESVYYVENAMAGGIVGLAGNPFDPNLVEVINCRNYGDINITSKAGGIMGIGYDPVYIEDCVNEGDLFSQGGERVGGIVGEVVGEIRNCLNKGSVVISAYYSAGIAGLSSATITDCHNEGYIEAYAHAGGICGSNVEGRIENCTNTGEIYGRGALMGGTTTEYPESTAGGIAGANNTGVIMNCINYGPVKGMDFIGGVIGASYYTALTQACVNHGAVTSTTERAGGVVGEIREGTVEACYNTGAVTSPSTAGGVAGALWDGAVLRASYSRGVLKVDECVGGIVGENAEQSQILYCYWSGTTTRSIGIDNSLDPVTQTITYKFGSTYWPQDNSANGWGVGNDYENGKFWQSLGVYSFEIIYPELYWIANR